jgi:hypothetical protein
MFWMGTAVTLMIAGIIALMVVVLGKRPVDLGKLGAASDRWIADHRVDSR